MTGPGRWRRVTWDYQPGTGTALAQTESLAEDGVPLQAGQERFCAVIADQAGTPAELAGADGTIAGYGQQTLWGGTLWHPDGAATPLRPGGRYHDSETGLHYRQRFYDPLTASYLAPDPLEDDPGPGITPGRTGIPV